MSLPLCKFYSLNQTCRFGKHCRYSHLLSQRPPPLLPEDNHENEKSVKDSVKASTSFSRKDTCDGSSYQNEESVNNSVKAFASFSRRDTCDSSSTSNQNEDSVKAQESALQVLSKANSNIAESIENAEGAVKPQQEQRLAKSIHKAVCHFFARNGTCRYGRDCRFSHQLSTNSRQNRNLPNRGRRGHGSLDVPPRFRKAEEEKLTDNSSHNGHPPIDSSVSYVKEENAGQETRREPLHPKNVPEKKDARREGYPVTEKRVCSFFKSGHCNWGRRCKFLHPVNDLPIEADKHKNEDEHKSLGEKEDSQKSSTSATRKPISKPVANKPLGLKQVFTNAEVEEIGSDKLRDSEINTIKKRFPHDKITIEENGGKFSARILFSPTDPDWPYDVEVFELLCTVPLEYPKKMLAVKLPPDQDLPETVRRYVEVTIKEWLDKKAEQLTSSGKVELVFRPFLRWLDRTIEEIATEALKQLKRELVAKAAGMEFISAQKLQDKYRAKSESSEGEHDRSQSDDDDEDESSEEEDDSSNESSSEEDEEKNNQSLDLDPSQKGTEIALRQLQLKENAGSLIFQKLRLILQCERCKNHSELTVPQGRVMSLRCGKCNQNQFVNYRAALIHQFSSIVGYLDVDGCIAFDLIFQDCQAVVTCMACSKLTTINGLVTGQPVSGWCQACNAKFKVAMEAVKFSQLVPSGIDTSVNKVVEVAPSKTKKPPKDPAIREGCPLPEFGTCKHYKHSYRWLRFPCCGKAYPCDICHDKKEDHEMELANRMICGHCCKEQNFTPSRPCKDCGQHLTKIRSAHWEGGSGCRDKIAMSKNDKQKHRNSNKTISNSKKKAQAGGKLKKVTKLRHS